MPRVVVALDRRMSNSPVAIFHGSAGFPFSRRKSEVTRLVTELDLLHRETKTGVLDPLRLLTLHYYVTRKTENLTDFLGVGIGEEVHEKMDGSQAEALIVRRQRPLQLLVVDNPAAILVSNLEASDYIGIGAGREAGRHQ